VSQFVSLPLAAAYVIRPTNSISILLLGVYMLMRHRKYVLPALAWSLLIAGPFVAFSLNVYGAVLPPYYRASRLDQHPGFYEALAGNMVSPARGLFIFSPILLLSAVGIWLKIHRRQFLLLDGLLLAAIVLHWAAISSFPHWWGGHSYGPRFFTDMTPYMVYFLMPVVAELRQAGPRVVARRVCLISAMVLLGGASFFIHMRGANAWSTMLWNVNPTNVDQHPERLWMWDDLQFLR